MGSNGMFSCYVLRLEHGAPSTRWRGGACATRLALVKKQGRHCEMPCKMLRFNAVILYSFVAITRCGILKHYEIRGCPLKGTSQLCPKRIRPHLVMKRMRKFLKSRFQAVPIKATFRWACVNSAALLSRAKMTWKKKRKKKEKKIDGTTKSTLN